MKSTVCVLFFLCLCYSLSAQAEATVCRSFHDPLTDYKFVIYVDPLNPNSTDDNTCYNSSDQKPCGSINFALAFPYKHFSTLFVLKSDVILGNNTSSVFSGSTHIAFYGDSNNNTVRIECETGAGLSFVSSADITICGVSFVNCGAWRNSTSKDFTNPKFKLNLFRVGLYFYNCRDVTLVHMSVFNSTNALGVVMYSTIGTNYIAHSQFNHNRISNSDNKTSGGGGFAVEFTFCIPGDNQCSNENHQIDNNSDSVYTFEDCTFINNRAIDQGGGNTSAGVFVLPANRIHSSFGRGGGLSVYFKGTAYNNSVTIHNCTISHNHANWGGGLLVEFDDNAIQNNVTVSESWFIENHCYFFHANGVAGGGVRVASSVYFNTEENKSLFRNEMIISGSNFSQNRALSGGGLSLSFHRQRLSHDHQVFQVNVINCSFEYNYARLGSAVNVEHEHFYPDGKMGKVFFQDCLFYNNRILYTHSLDPYSVGIGAVYVSEVAVSFSGFTTFKENNGTALAIIGTSVNITSDHAQFLENDGYKGGAISLLGVANIIVGKGTNMLFTNNTAKLYGGAIYNQYIGMEDLPSTVKCFLRYDDPFLSPELWDAKFKFSGNTAGKLGNSIFSSTILPCSWSADVQADIDTVKDIFCWNSSVWVYDNSSCLDQIYSFPRSFNVTGAKKVVFPGHGFHLNVTAYDDLGHNVTSQVVYTAEVVGNNASVSTASVQPQYAYIADGYVGITGQENQNITLKLDVAGPRDWHIELPLMIEKCPPGFRLDNGSNIASTHDQISIHTSQCECIGGKGQPYTYRGNLICDESNFTSGIRNTYWIGVVSDVSNDTLLMAEASIIYKTHAHTEFLVLPQLHEQLDKIQCESLNSTGPLCGKCLDGYATAVNSPSYKCVLCASNSTNLPLNIFAYISLTYIPHLVLFLFIIYFDIRVMSGPAVGFILYAQLVGAGLFDLGNGNLSYTNSGDIPPKLEKAYQIVYGIFNLDSLSQLMDPFCVNVNFSALDVISLDFAIAVFPLCLIIVIRLILRLKSIKFRDRRKGIRDTTTVDALQSVEKVRGKTLLHPFIAFMYLSYTKFSITSAKLLATTQLFDENGKGFNPRLVYYAGQYTFNNPHYFFPYGLIALLVLIFFAALLPLLLLGPFQFIDWLIDKPRFEGFRRYWPSIRVHIFLDAFQGCYKPNRRYFAGIYFLFRLIMFILFAFTGNEISNLLWQQLFCTIMIVLVAFFQPYKIKFYNYVDILIFLNLAAINAISIYFYTRHVENVRSEFPITMFVFGLILIWLPLVYMLLYLSWWGIQKTSCCSAIREKIAPLSRPFQPLFYSDGDEPERRTLLNPVARGRSSPNITESQNSLSDSGMFKRAETPNLFRPRPRSQITSTVVTAYGTGGTADAYGTQISASSGIMSGVTEEYSNTGSTQSSKGRSTDTD